MTRLLEHAHRLVILTLCDAGQATLAEIIRHTGLDHFAAHRALLALEQDRRIRVHRRRGHPILYRPTGDGYALGRVARPALPAAVLPRRGMTEAEALAQMEADRAAVSPAKG